MRNKSGIKDISKNDIGFSIRTRRKQLKKTMQELADAAGLSVGFISQLERNLVIPSLSSLASIASVLKVEVSYFLDAPTVSSKISRKKDREFFKIHGSRPVYSKLNKIQSGSQLISVMTKTPPGYLSEKVSHEGEEQVILMEGKGFVVLDDERYDLEAGDCVHYMSKTPHQYGTRGKKEAVWICVGTQPLFDMENEQQD